MPPPRLPWLLLALTLCRAASAQPEPGAETAAAERLVAEGIALRARGRDAEALGVFERAQQLEPASARVQIHLATTHQALGNWLLADDYLSKALARGDDPYVERHRQALEDARRVIDSNIGRLEVEGGPPGAQVRLSGRLVGSLPFAAPVRSKVGTYTLEVRLEGHHPARRPIVITGGGLVRESVQLEPWPEDVARSTPGQGGAREPALGAAPAGGAEAEAGAEAEGGAWLTWTLGGAAALAGAATIGAVALREVYAGRWNDNARCLELERTRAEVCAGERDKVETAETWAWITGGAAGLLAAGALLSGLSVFDAKAGEAAPRSGLRGCAIGWAGVSCHGAF